MQPVALQAMAIARIGYFKLLHRSYCKLQQFIALQTIANSRIAISYCKLLRCKL